MRRARRAGPLALTGVLVVSLLGGCASDTDRYCGELRQQKQTLSDLAVQSEKPGNDVLANTLDVWRKLRDKAPDDIHDEWDTLVFALEGVVEAFDAAGTSLADYDPAHRPPGVSDAEAKRIEDSAGELTSSRVTKAGDSVEQHARDVCQVDLGLSGGGAG
jgi:hypothetical protein